MELFRKFLNKRKQDDRIKIVAIFMLLGVLMLSNSIYRLVKLYKIINNTVEYVLADNSGTNLKDSAINELIQIENVVTASRQTEKTLNFYDNEDNITLNCIGLSDEYLKTAYNVNINSSMKIFYINKKAYDMLVQIDKFESDFLNNKDGIIADYTLGEEGEEKYSGKVIFIENGLPNDKPYAFLKTDNLNKDSDSIRVFASKDDLMGEMSESFTNRGYVISNNDIINQRNSHYKVELLHIKYSMATSGLCFLFVFCIFVKFMKC